MAFVLKGTGSASTANSTTADQASLVVTTATTAGAAGDLAVLIYALDNNQTTDGDEGAVTDVSDSGGNQWRKAVEFTNGQGTAQTGATNGIWYSNLRAAISVGGTVTLTFSNATSRDATAASLTYFTKAAGFNAELAAAPTTLANDAAAAGSLNVTTPNIACLRVRGIASEALLVTALTPTATFAIVTQSIASTGVAATSMAVRGEWVINTGTGTASAPTAGAGAVDNASVYAAFKEVPTTDWITPLSEPVRYKPPVRKATVSPWVGAPAAVAVRMTWFQPLSMPVRPRVSTARLADDGLFATPFTPPAVVVPGMDWLTPLSTPVRANPRLHPSLQDAETDAYLTTAEVITMDEWFNGLTIPNRAKQRAIADYAFAPLAISEVVTVDKWFNPLAPPLYAKRGLVTYEQQFTAFTPENFPSCGLVGVDTEGTKLVGGSSVTTIDYTGITVGDGPNRALVAMAETDTATIGMTAVWDQGGTNQSMTLIGTTTTGVGQTVAIFGLCNPIGGNNTLRFSWTTAGFPTVSAVSLITVDQSSDANAFQNYQHSSGNVASLSVTVPSKPGDVVVGIGCAAGPTVTAVGDNSIYIDNTSVGNHSGAGWNVGAASVTFTGTSSTPGNWLLGAINVSAYPCPVDTDFILPLSEVPRRKAALHPSQQDASTPDVFQTTEIVTVDKWFDALSEPARTKSFNPALYRTLAAEYFPDTPNANAGLWLGSFAEPLRVKSRFSAIQQTYTSGYAPFEVVTVDKWFDALSEPARVKRGLNAALQVALTAEYFPDTFTQWLIPLSEPARTKRSLNTPDQIWVPFVTTETVTVDKWFDGLSEPVRVRSRLSALQQAYTSGYAQLELITVDKWFDPLSEPVRAKPSLRAALQPTTTYDAKLFPDPANFLEGWSSGLAEPVRQKLGLNTALQSTYTSGYFSFEIITVDKWYASLSDPKRFKPALHVSLQQTITQDTVFIPSPSRYEGWYGALSEPQRQKAAAQQPTTVVPLTTTEVVTVDKWFGNLSDPTRRKPEDRDRYNAENEFTAIAATMKWYAPLTEPVRQRQALATANQQAYFSSLAFTAAEVVTVDKWFKSYADLVRMKVPTDDRYQGENNWEAIAASMEWFAPFTEPLHSKPGLVPATRPPFFASPTVIIIPSLASWWRPLAEPPKAKVRLGTHLQQAFTQDPKLFPSPTRFLEGWYNWWSEPVRHLAQLNAALQRSWTASDRRPVLATITVTMAVTEVNNDVALFAIKVFAGNPPVTAVVSLVEIGHGASLTSIVEEGDDGSGTSIVES